MRLFKWAFLGLISITGLTVVYFWLTYTDITITQGKWHGIAIGQSKGEAFLSAKSQFAKNDVYIPYPIDTNTFGAHRQINFSEGDFDILRNRETWELYFRYGDYSNVLRLHFGANEKLAEIYRHKHAFELP
jgi:hypothetical protein